MLSKPKGNGLFFGSGFQEERFGRLLAIDAKRYLGFREIKVREKT